VLAPRAVAHDAALRLEAAGFDLVSTGALAAARARKGATERDRIAAVARTATAAVAAVRAGPADVEAAVRAGARAVAGVEPGATPGVEVASAGDLRVVRAAPRGPAGYRAVCARTLAPGADGGWERRAHVACESARRVAVETVAPGVDLAEVRAELLGELSAFGLAPPPEAVPVHGIGLAARERPRGADATLAAGHVLVVRAAAAAETGPERVVLADTVAVTDEGSPAGDGERSPAGDGERSPAGDDGDGALVLTDAPTGL
jgi:Xaa-Pro aminopeptidase